MKNISIRAIVKMVFSCFLAFTSLSVHGNIINTGGGLPTDTLSVPLARLKILSWNIGMLPFFDLFKEENDRADAIANALDNSNDYDIVVFQEAFTSQARSIINYKLRDWYPYSYGPVNESKWSLKVNSGIWILSKIPLQIKKEIEFSVSAGFDALTRKGAVLLEGQFQNSSFQLIAAHLQDDRYSQDIRKYQFEQMYEQLILPYSDPNITQIICGDFNTDNKMEENYCGMLKILNAEDGEISGNIKITFDDSSNDAFKSIHADPRQIDYILTRNSQSIEWISRKIIVLKSRWGRGKEYLSDHHGIEADIIFRTFGFLTEINK